MHLHGEALAMSGALFADHLITRLGASAGPQQLLQSGFVVGYEEHLAAGVGEPIELRLQNMGENKGARREESAIEIQGGEDGFDGVSQQGGFAAASGLLLAASKPEIAAELQLLGAVHQVIGIDQMSAELGKFTFLIGRKALEQFLAGDQLQDGIAEKLQLLVVARRASGLSRAKEL